MDYEQKYNKLVNAIKVLQETNLSDEGIQNWVNDNVPELCESEDDRIRKGIIRNLEYLADRAEGFVKDELKERIAWLEKQGHTDSIIEKAKTEKQRVIITETDGNANIDWDTRSLQDVKLLLEYGLDYINKLNEKNCFSNTKPSMGDLKIISSLKDIVYAYWNSLPDSALEENEVAESCYRWLEKKYEQSSLNKIEPKFHEGEWITFTREDGTREVLQVSDIIDGRYYFNHLLQFSWSIKECDEKCHLWTIQDAKDGDVLVTHSDIVFIFKNIMEGGTISFHAALSTPNFSSNTKIHIPEDNEQLGDQEVFPATKEQRDFLFQKMHEAGYMWDSKSKQLLSLKAEPSGKQKPAEWSEEDEQHIDSLLKRLDGLCRNEFERTRFAISEDEDWLKSLKQRMGWKPSEEQMKALHDMNLTGNISYAGQGQILIELYNDLKKL